VSAVHRDNQTIRAIQEAQPIYLRDGEALRRLHRFRWTAIFIYGASAAFGVVFWLIVLKFAAHIP